MTTTTKVKKVTQTLPQVSDTRPFLGCDPEFFFKTKDNQTVGAEKVFKKDGLPVEDRHGKHKFIIDGVQAELNPAPQICRAYLGNSIKSCMIELDKTLKLQNKGLTADFSRTVEISKENLMDLDEEARKFGCAPSLSAASTVGIKIQDIDPTEYRVRAAGGHIHIGHHGANLRETDVYYRLHKAVTEDAERTVKMLDLICGNTCVLIDRDPSNVERRKLYGRASEYRLPKHGLEYRTLSNFWLQSYQLMSFTFGMARLAVQLMSDNKNHNLFYEEFTSLVKTKDVEDAINFNDFDQAMNNFLTIQPLILKVPADTGALPISPSTIDAFHYFVKTSKKEGLQKWFPQDPMTHWTTIPECHTGGCHDWFLQTVDPVRKKLEPAKAKVKAA